MTSGKTAALSFALAAQGLALAWLAVVAELPVRDSGTTAEVLPSEAAAAPPHPDNPATAAESQPSGSSAEPPPPADRQRKRRRLILLPAADPAPWPIGPRPRTDPSGQPSPTVRHSHRPRRRVYHLPAGDTEPDPDWLRLRTAPIWPPSFPVSAGSLPSSAPEEPQLSVTPSSGDPADQPGSPGTLAAQVPGGVCGAVTAEPQAFNHQVGHQRIAFFWPVAEGARYYRLQESRGEGGFKDIKGAARIADTSYCLRIRHWDTAWGQTRYRLLACPGGDQPCAEAGSLDLAAEAANRSVADIIHSGIRSTPDSQRRTALALSADGGTMAWAGSERENDKSLGRDRPWYSESPDTVNISVREGGIWRLQASFRTGHEPNSGNTDIAKAVALSADGGVMAFGATNHVRQTWPTPSHLGLYSQYGEGAVYVYARDGEEWSRQAVIGPGATARSSFKFGAALALSADGRTLAVGQPLKNLGWQSVGTARTRTEPSGSYYFHGSVAVFQRTGDEWRRQDVLRAPRHGHYDFFGQSIALSADGSALAVGMPGDDSGYQRRGSEADPGADPVYDSGAVYLYSRSGGDWRMDAIVKSGGTRRGDRLGTSVSLNAAGDLLVAGAPGLSPGVSFFSSRAPGSATDELSLSAGAAYLFALRDGRWTQTARLSEGVPGVHDSFGASVSLSGAGDVLAVGAPEEASGPGLEASHAAGAVYVYTVSGEGAVLRRRLGDPRPRIWGQYGAFLALSGDGSTLATASPGWSTLVSILDTTPLELARIRESGRHNFRSLYVY